MTTKCASLSFGTAIARELFTFACTHSRLGYLLAGKGGGREKAIPGEGKRDPLGGGNCWKGREGSNHPERPLERAQQQTSVQSEGVPKWGKRGSFVGLKDNFNLCFVQPENTVFYLFLYILEFNH